MNKNIMHPKIGKMFRYSTGAGIMNEPQNIDRKIRQVEFKEYKQVCHYQKKRASISFICKCNQT